MLPAIKEATAIMEERQEDYGDFKPQWRVIAGLWSEVVGRRLKPSEALYMMSLLKIGRAITGTYKFDNAIDGVNYQAMADVMQKAGE